MDFLDYPDVSMETRGAMVSRINYDIDIAMTYDTTPIRIRMIILKTNKLYIADGWKVETNR